MPAVAVGNVFDDPVLMALNDVEQEAGHDSFEPGKFFGNIHAHAYPIFNYTGRL
jgi:hypothetical protein